MKFMKTVLCQEKRFRKWKQMHMFNTNLCISLYGLSINTELLLV